MHRIIILFTLVIICTCFNAVAYANAAVGSKHHQSIYAKMVRQHWSSSFGINATDFEVSKRIKSQNSFLLESHNNQWYNTDLYIDNDSELFPIVAIEGNVSFKSSEKGYCWQPSCVSSIYEPLSYADKIKQCLKSECRITPNDTSLNTNIKAKTGDTVVIYFNAKHSNLIGYSGGNAIAQNTYHHNGQGMKLCIGSSCKQVVTSTQKKYGKSTGHYATFPVSSDGDVSLQLNLPASANTGQYIFDVLIHHAQYNVGVRGVYQNQDDLGALEFAIANEKKNPNNTILNENQRLNLTLNTIDGLSYYNIQKEAHQPEGKLWVKVRDSYHGDNDGAYTVTAIVPTEKKSNNWLEGSVIIPVKEILQSGTKPIYDKFIKSPTYLITIKALLSMYLAFYAITFMLGIIQDKQKDLVVRTLKVGIIYTLISPQGWTFFQSHMFDIFDTGVGALTEVIAQSIYSTENNIGITIIIERIFEVYSSGKLWNILGGMFFVPIIGVVCFITLLFALITCVVVMFEIVVQYLICIAMLAILISVAPIFIPMLLFQQTQEMFDGWFKFLVYHAVFPLFIFFVVLVFGELLVSILQSAMNAFALNQGCVQKFHIKIGNIVLFSKCLKGWVINADSMTHIFSYTFMIYLASKMFWKSMDVAKQMVAYILNVYELLNVR